MAERTASRTPGNLWTSTVHLLFGNPATCVRPVALRPRLATGLPFIARSQPGGVDRWQQGTAVVLDDARGLSGGWWPVPPPTGAVPEPVSTPWRATAVGTDGIRGPAPMGRVGDARTEPCDS